MPFPIDDRRTAAIETYDPAKILTRMALLMVLILIVFICAIIGAQIWKSGEANTESWAALTGIVGWATGVVGTIYSNRFGSTQQAAAKDATIEQQARATAATAVVAAAAATGTGNGAVTPAKTDNMTVDADKVIVTEKDPKP